jgi:putative transposase
VCDSLMKFDSKRYFVDAFVIMPNHVHLLWQMAGASSNVRELKSMKGATSRVCNSWLDLSGTFWMEGSYNRIVRDEEELYAFREYIAANPVRAELAEDEFSLVSPHVLQTS